MRALHSRTFVLLVALVALAAGAPRARANDDDDCRRDGKLCFTNTACCSRSCVRSSPPRLFGTCCTHTTCAAHGFNCGLIADGDCPGKIDCGSCTAPDTCGGGGRPNVCGCRPIKTCPAGMNCGTIPDGLRRHAELRDLPVSQFLRRWRNGERLRLHAAHALSRRSQLRLGPRRLRRYRELRRCMHWE